MPTLKEIAKYLCCRQTAFTCVLFLLYALVIHYCGRVGVDDIHRYERFDSDEHFTLEEQIGARFSEYAIYEPHGKHADATAPFAGGVARIRVLSISEANLFREEDGLERELPVWLPLDVQSLSARTPVVLMLNTSLANAVRDEARGELGPDKSPKARVCGTLSHLLSRIPSQLVVPAFSSKEVEQTILTCLTLPQTAGGDGDTSYALPDLGITVSVVSGWSDWVATMWHANHSATPSLSRPNSVLATRVLIFAEPVGEMPVPETILSSAGQACARVVGTPWTLTSLYAQNTADALNSLACVAELMVPLEYGAKTHYDADAVHAVVMLPGEASRVPPNVGMRWLGLNGTSLAHLVSIVPQSPLAFLSQ